MTDGTLDQPNPKTVGDLTPETVLGRPGPMEGVPAYLKARAARKMPDKTVTSGNIRQKPIFPALTQAYVDYLKDCDASPGLIAAAQRSVDKAKAETNPPKKTSWWAKIRSRS